MWEAASRACVLSKVHRIKHNSQLLGCALFFSGVQWWTVYKTGLRCWGGGSWPHSHQPGVISSLARGFGFFLYVKVTMWLSRQWWFRVKPATQGQWWGQFYILSPLFAFSSVFSTFSPVLASFFPISIGGHTRELNIFYISYWIQILWFLLLNLK